MKNKVKYMLLYSKNQVKVWIVYKQIVHTYNYVTLVTLFPLSKVKRNSLKEFT